jgi:Bacterial Ig-like domain
MTHRRWFRSALAIGIVACSDDPSDPGGDEGLRLTSVQPGDGATGVSWKTTFEATLSADLDPATLAGRVELTLEGAPVPAVITYDPPNHSIRMTAPLLPGATYRAEIKPGIRSLAGDSLAEGRVWTATARAWDPEVVAGVGELELFDVGFDQSGGVHLFGNGEYRPWSDYAEPYRKYIACTSDCGVPSNWGRMAVDSGYEPFLYTALEVGESGRVHLLHAGRRENAPDVELRYGTCGSDCLTPANWVFATLDAERRLAALAVDGSGNLHLLTGPMGEKPDLRYDTCAAECTDPANWSSAAIPVVGYGYGTNLRVDGTGRLHLVTVSPESYSTCPSNCLSPAQWSTTPAEWVGTAARSISLAVEPAGPIHMVFSDATRTFTYARCDADCADPASWQALRLDEGDLYGSALTVDETGRITALNPLALSGELRFLTCVADCLDAASWQIATVDHPDIFQSIDGGTPRLALDPQGAPALIYNDGARVLRYLE